MTASNDQSSHDTAQQIADLAATDAVLFSSIYEALAEYVDRRGEEESVDGTAFLVGAEAVLAAFDQRLADDLEEGYDPDWRNG